MKFRAIIFSAFILLCSFTIAVLKPVDEDDAVSFTIKNFGFNTNGSFKGLKGTINWNAENIAASAFDVTIDAASVNTNTDMRDNHLRKEEYFDVGKYPIIHFVSTAVSSSTITANLTIKGVTKTISFPFTVQPSGSEYLFMGSFTINRRDFNVGAGSAVLADNVVINLKVKAKP